MEDSRINIWALGFARSGTHWLAWLLGEALDSPVSAHQEDRRSWAPDGGDRPGPYIVRHVTVDVGDDGPVILIVRDPRDVMASQMQYWNHSFEKRWNKVRNWTKYYEGWLPRALAVVRYEDLHSNCEGALARVLREADLEIDAGRIRRACFRQQFKLKRHWQSEGRWVPNNFFYKGKVGNWKEDLTPGQAHIIESAHSEMMEKFGYG